MSRPEPRTIRGRAVLLVEDACSVKASVYRLYAAGPRLLYVGMATLPLSVRLAAHREKSWWAEVRYVTAQRFADPRAAATAEMEAIQSERPIHNRIGAPMFSAGRHGRPKTGEGGAPREVLDYGISGGGRNIPLHHLPHRLRETTMIDRPSVAAAYLDVAVG